VTTSPEDINTVITDHLPELRKPGALSVRPGFEVKDHWLTGRPAVVVTVEKKAPDSQLAPADRLPEAVGGIPVDVHQATDLEASRLKDPGAFVAHALTLAPETRPAALPMERKLDGTPVTTTTLGKVAHSAKPEIGYTPAPGVALEPLTGQFTIQCMVSPDQSWPHLETFLGATTTSLTVGMYDFTSAHILKAVGTSLAGKQLKLVLDNPPRNPSADQVDAETAKELASAIGHGLHFAWALDNHDVLAKAWIYPSAYHIKVAVRDGKSVWLSSGNWNNSNQPAIDPAANPHDATQTNEARGRDRDWHVIIDHPGVAHMFEAYLTHDLDIATPQSDPVPKAPAAAPKPGAPTNLTPNFGQFFPAQGFTDQMTVTPLLTPDPGLYVAAVTELVKSAQHTLYLQYQYVEPNVKAPQAFQDLIAAVVARHTAGVDVKIIASEFQKRAHLELLQGMGFDVVTRFKIQNNVHNKGIVVDTKKVLVSSQNWSSAGVLDNRDAGVIVECGPVAAYFEKIFLHDWNTLSEHKLGA
jgi:phosphatidylserine/phosphatidylglycerophosphate/cardiolipin synthase-like enzyme